MKNIINKITDISMVLFWGFMYIIMFALLFFIIAAIAGCAIFIVWQLINFVTNLSHSVFKRIFTPLYLDYRGNSFLFTKYILAVLFLVFSAGLSIYLYIKYRNLNRIYTNSYIPFRNLTKKQQDFLPKLSLSLSKCAFLRLRIGQLSVNELILSLRKRFDKDKDYHLEVEFLIEQVLFQKYNAFGRTLTILEWKDIFDEQRELGINGTIGEYLSDEEQCNLVLLVRQMKRYFIEQLKRGVYDEDLILCDVSRKFHESLNFLKVDDRIYLDKIFTSLKFTQNDDTLSLHGWTDYYKDRKPMYIEGNLFKERGEQ